MRKLNSHYRETETSRKNEMSPHKAKVVLEINNPGVLTSTIYYYCWLRKGGKNVDLKAILLYRELKISTSV